MEVFNFTNVFLLFSCSIEDLFISHHAVYKRYSFVGCNIFLSFEMAKHATLCTIREN